MSAADSSGNSAASALLEVTDRPSLWRQLASAGDVAQMRQCLCAYTPPAKRLILRSEADFERLCITKEAVHAACDPSFWAYGDFESVYNSFARNEKDPERRVMGIEGIASPEALRETIASGATSLKIGHLSLVMMQSKVSNGEWHWVDEPKCVMHTATPKPALLRGEVRSRMGVEIKVLRHEAFAEQAESVGDLIIFDMDKADVTQETGNTKARRLTRRSCASPPTHPGQPMSRHTGLLSGLGQLRDRCVSDALRRDSGGSQANAEARVYRALK